MASLTSKIFIPQATVGLNVQKAADFGELRTILPESANPFNPDQLLLLAAQELKAQDYDPTRDYIVFSAKSNVLAMIAGLIMSKHPKFKILLFDARKQGYVERVLVSPYHI